jgi:hypothetical protein
MTTRISNHSDMSLKQLLVGLAATLAVSCARPTPTRKVYPFTEAERQAVEDLLKEQPGWRVAISADNAAPDLAAQRREQPGYEPYFVRFPRGSHPDFAVVLVRSAQYSVYWFRADSGRYCPFEVTSADWLRTAGLHLRGDTLEVAPFHSDEIFAFAWDSAAHQPVLLEPSADAQE